ncbi:CDP-alcohol phosphatidyltransferase family protein [Nanoarchaeota archaeon]
MLINQKIRKKLGIYSNKKFIKLYNMGFTPNRVTMISIFFEFLTFYFILNGQLVLAGISTALDYIMDGLDGAIARSAKKSTKFGAYLDMISDNFLRRIGYVLLAYKGFMSYGLLTTCLVIIAFNFIFLHLIRKTKLKVPAALPMWSDAVLIYFALFTGKVAFFFTLIVIIDLSILLFDIGTISFLNLVKKRS